MATLLSNLLNNLSEGTHKIKCKYRHGVKTKNAKSAALNINITTVFLNTQDDLIQYKCLFGE